VTTVRASRHRPELVRFVSFDETTQRLYEALLD
jgi:hypothetical protein